MCASAQGVTIRLMPLPQEVFAEIQGLLRKPSEWFSVSELRKHRPELFVTEFIQKPRDFMSTQAQTTAPTDRILSFPHPPDQVYRDLEAYAAGLLERELCSRELAIAGLLADNSVTPSAEEDLVIVSTLTEYTKAAVDEIRAKFVTILGCLRTQGRDRGQSWMRRQSALCRNRL